MPRIEPQLDTTIDIITPENISFQYEVAGPFRRVPAFLLDLGIRIAIVFSLVLMLGLLNASQVVVIVTVFLTYFVLEWFYGGVLETYWNGQTIGKRMMGIRVLSVDGQPINGLQGMMRNILRLADLMPLIPASAFGDGWYFPIPTGMIGLVVPLLNPRFQRLGDLVCGTIVIVEEKSRLLVAADFKDARVKQLAVQLPAGVQLSRKTSQALATYVERRRYLSAARLAEIAAHLAKPLMPRFGLPADTNYDLFVCALYYRTFVVQKHDADSRPTELLESDKPVISAAR